MAGDPAFNNNGSTPPAAPAATPPAPAYITAEQFAQYQQQQLAAQQKFAGDVVKAIQAVRAPAAPPAPTAPSDVAQRLLENPDAVLNEKFQAWFQQNVAPSMRMQMGDAADRLLAENRAAVDAEFGPGAFDKHILPTFNRTLEQIGENRDVIRSNAQSVRSIIDSAIGQQRSALYTDKAAYDKAQAEKAAQQPDQPPYLVGQTFAPRPPKGELMPHEQTIVDRARIVAGDNFDDMPELLALREAWVGGLGAAEAGNAHPGISVDAVRGFMNNMSNGEGKK